VGATGMEEEEEEEEEENSRYSCYILGGKATDTLG
jgi:hypothetical protein